MKRSLTAALAVVLGACLAQPDHAAPVLPASESPAAEVHADTAAAPPTHPTTPRTAEPATEPVTRPNHNAVGHHDADVIARPLALAQQDLDDLLDSGHLTLDLPDGQRVTLDLAGRDDRPNHQLLRVRSAGGAGQFTRNAHGFFGTVATDIAVYSIENQGVMTTIITHAELDQRLLPGLADDRIPNDA